MPVSVIPALAIDTSSTLEAAYPRAGTAARVADQLRRASAGRSGTSARPGATQSSSPDSSGKRPPAAAIRNSSRAMAAPSSHSGRPRRRAGNLSRPVTAGTACIVLNPK